MDNGGLISLLFMESNSKPLSPEMPAEKKCLLLIKNIEKEILMKHIYQNIVCDQVQILFYD